MKAQFLSPLRVEQISEKNWKLIDPLTYWSNILNHTIIVPAGFVTDFASVPRLPFIYWMAGGAADMPAVLHDWLYRTGSEDITRKNADAVFKEAINSMDHYWKIHAWAMWLGVRIGGYWAFKTRTKQALCTISSA